LNLLVTTKKEVKPGETIYEMKKDIDLKVDYKVNSNLDVGADLCWKVDANETNLKLYEKYQFGKGSSLKLRLDNFETLLAGFSHSFGVIDFNFVTRFKLHRAAAEAKEFSHFKTKFGLSFELNDTF